MEAIEIKVGRALSSFNGSVALVSAALGEHGLHVRIYVNGEEMRRNGEMLWLNLDELAALQDLLTRAKDAADRLGQLAPPTLPGR